MRTLFNLNSASRMAIALSLGLVLVPIFPLEATGQNPSHSPRRRPAQATESDHSTPNLQCPDLGSAAWVAQERIIFITNEINADLAEQVITQLLYLDAQSAASDIYLYINSPGGDVNAGLAIYDVMRSLRSDIVTVSVGESSSMASILLAGGTKGKRFALPNARVMIHQPSSGVVGKASDIAIEAKEIVFQRSRLNRILANLTGQPLQRIETDTDRDFFMSAQEAKTYGLIDNIINRLPSISNPTGK